MTQVLENTVIWGSSSEHSIDVFEEQHQIRPVTFNPDRVDGYSEERADDPRYPARGKSNVVIDRYPRQSEEEITVLTADVIFIGPDGQVHHKPEITDEATRDAVLAETEAWYCSDAFVVRWLIAFVVQTSDGMRRNAVLQIEGKFDQPLAAETVRAQFDPNINARLPLVENGFGSQASFYLNNLDETGQTPVEIPQELAVQLIFYRVLTPTMLWELIEKMAAQIEDEYWELVYLTIHQQN